MHRAAVTTNSNQLTSWNEIPVEEKIKTHSEKYLKLSRRPQVITVFTTTCWQTQSYFNSFTNTSQSSLISSGFQTINSERMYLLPSPPPPPARQPWVGLGLLKQISPASFILGICLPTTTQFPFVILHPLNPSWFQLATSSVTSRVCPHYVFSFSSIHTWPTHLRLLNFITLTIFGSL